MVQEGTDKHSLCGAAGDRQSTDIACVMQEGTGGHTLCGAGGHSLCGDS